MADEESRFDVGGRSASDVLGQDRGAEQEAAAPDDQIEDRTVHTPDEPQARTFDPRYREALVGLLYIGHLTDTFTWGGHHFVVRTLTAGEQIEAGLLIRPTLGTRVEMKAHSASYVAGGLVTVDHEPLIVPLGVTEVTMREKYLALMKWSSLTLDVVYSRIYALEMQAREVADALGEAHGQGPQTPG